MQCPHPITVYPSGAPQVVPCSKCMVCLVNKRQEWAFRLKQEHKYSSASHFITLTYDNRHLPGYGVCKSDVQKFLKRLRKKCENRLRYYAVAEYGEETGRPHYHMLLFNADELTDKLLKLTWKYGLVHIGKVTDAAVMYCLKYMVQPDIKPPQGMNKAFRLMSRSYAIGGKYLTDQMVAWHKEDDRMYAIDQGKKVRLARFYKDKIWPTKELYKVDGKVYLLEKSPSRKRVQEKAKMDGIRRHRKEIRAMKKLGYKNVNQVLAEFRNAALARIKVKVAYTQKL